MKSKWSAVIGFLGIVGLVWALPQLGMLTYSASDGVATSSSWILKIAAVVSALAAVFPQIKPIWDAIRPFFPGGGGTVPAPTKPATELEPAVMREFQNCSQAVAYLSDQLEGVEGAPEALKTLWMLIWEKSREKGVKPNAV